jgi:hypothetical protein
VRGVLEYKPWHFGTEFRRLNQVYAAGASVIAKAFCVYNIYVAYRGSSASRNGRAHSTEELKDLLRSGYVFVKLCHFVSMRAYNALIR